MVSADWFQIKDRQPVSTGTIRIVETTDLHMQILPFDYFTDQPDRTKGLVQLADQIVSLQSAPDGLTLLFDNGDFLQGNPLADLIAENGLHNAVHPMIGAFATLRYDAVALGNHEFNYGLAFWTRCCAMPPLRSFAPM